MLPASTTLSHDYSTARGGEVREALAKVAQIATAGAEVISIETARHRRNRA